MSALKSMLIHDRESGTVRKATADEIIQAARACLVNRIRRGASLASPETVRDYLVLRFGTLQHEVFSIIYLDSRHRVIDCQDLFRGTVDGASVHPREVVKEALQRNAAACILAHNHPSGVAEPSAADELITQKVRDALALVDIRVVDHVVVAAGGSVSFAERGLL
jgi:DNA repair protein RadC